jgi:uncharacterized protein
MASADLLHLWKLHLVDASLKDIRDKAAALDPGRSIMARLEKAQKELDEVGGEAKALHAEQVDLELKQKTIDDKIKKFEKDLYGGSVVNPREVEAINRELAILKKQRGELDVRILELWELVPPAQAKSSNEQQAVDALKSELKAFQKGALELKGQLEREFKSVAAQRSEAAKNVPSGMLARYEAIRQRHGGIGMSRISKRGTCGACGTSLPTKVIEDVKDDRMVTCEECHRILYYSESVV